MMDSVRANLPADKVVPAAACTGVPGNPAAQGSDAAAPSLWNSVAGYQVTKVIDYRDGYEDIPASNVLRFFLKNGSWFAVRPSGTEPKIKFYFYSKQDSAEAARAVNEKIRDAVLETISAVE
jgi:phosphoglucomutase